MVDRFFSRSIKALKLALELFAPSEASNAAPELSALARSGEARALHGLASACGRLEEMGMGQWGYIRFVPGEETGCVYIYMYIYRM